MRPSLALLPAHQAFPHLLPAAGTGVRRTGGLLKSAMRGLLRAPRHARPSLRQGSQPLRPSVRSLTAKAQAEPFTITTPLFYANAGVHAACLRLQQLHASMLLANAQRRATLTSIPGTLHSRGLRTTLRPNARRTYRE